MMRRRNIQHGQARRYVSRLDLVVLGVLAAVAITGLVLMVSPMFGGA